MKIMFIAPRMHTNQVPILKGLLEKGFEVRFYAFCKGISEDYTYINPILVRMSFLAKLIVGYNNKFYNPDIAESKNIRWFMPAISFVWRELKDYKPDIVILRERSKANAIIYLICKALKIKKVIMYNQAPISMEYRGIKNIFFPKVRYSPVVLSECQNQIKGDDLMYNCAPHTYFMPFVYSVKCNHLVSVKGRNVIQIIDVGKFRDYKNHYILVEAASILISRGIDNFRISILGQVSSSSEEKYFQDLNRYVKEKKVGEYVELKKNIPYSEMDDLYSQYDMLVLPSKREVAGMVVLEAMANGLGVISTDMNGTAFYLKLAKSGMIFDHQCATDLADKIMYYLDNPCLLEADGQKAKDFISEFCSIDMFLTVLNHICVREFGDESLDDFKMKDC